MERASDTALCVNTHAHTQHSSVLHDFSGTGEASDTALSLLVHPLGQETYVFAVCRDHKLRMWAAKVRDREGGRKCWGKVDCVWSCACVCDRKFKLGRVCVCA